jgi:cell fate (sporulation/competence/biofilm development) regulator YlbF (YheA/YmcA/DUF963 family)
MKVPPDSVPSTTRIDPFQAARNLGSLLSQTPEYKAYIEAQKAVNSDPTSYRLSVQLRGHQNAIQCGRDLYGEHAAELTRLELKMEDLTVVKHLHETAKEIGALFQAVDKMISYETGMDFAINAKRGGCACGG